MAQSVIEFVEASRTLLDALQSTSATQATEFSKKQGSAIVARVAQLPMLGAADAAKLASMISAAKFAKGDMAVMLEAIANKTSAEPADVSQKKGQSYEAYFAFLPEAVWASMSQNAPEELFMHLHALGLRRPSEPTAQAMAVGLLLTSAGLEKSMAHTMAARTHMVKTTKSWFLKSCNGLGAPAEWCWRLPPTPAKLQQIHPKLYAAAFAKGPPVACKLDMLHVETLRMQSPMRAPKGGSAGGGCMSVPTAMSSTPAVQDMTTMMWTMLQHAMAGARGFADNPLGLTICEPRFARLGSQPELPALQTTPTRGLNAGSSTQSIARSSPPDSPRQGLPTTPALEDEPDHLNDECEGRKKKVGDAIACIMGAVGKAKELRSLKRSSAEIEEGAGAKGKKGQKKNKKETPKVENPKTDKPKKDNKQPLPTLTHEGSRRQYLVRSGFKGVGQNKIFRYQGDGDRPKVLRAAQAHCRTLCSERGLPVPDRFKA